MMNMIKIKFEDEVQRYTIQAYDENYMLLTKPFNPMKTYLYTIIDLKNQTRGYFGRWGLPISEDINSPDGARVLLKGLGSEFSVPAKYTLPLMDSEIAQINLYIKEKEDRDD